MNQRLGEAYLILACTNLNPCLVADNCLGRHQGNTQTLYNHKDVQQQMHGIEFRSFGLMELVTYRVSRRKGNFVAK